MTTLAIETKLAEPVPLRQPYNGLLFNQALTIRHDPLHQGADSEPGAAGVDVAVFFFPSITGLATSRCAQGVSFDELLEE